MTELLIALVLNIVLGVILVGAIVGACGAWNYASKAAALFNSAAVHKAREAAQAERLASSVERLHTAAIEAPNGGRARVLTREVEVPAASSTAHNNPLRASTRPFEQTGDTRDGRTTDPHP